jgi:uncharacterized protein (DUF433 family)
MSPVPNAAKSVVMQNWGDRICVNPAVCHGRACIRGTGLWSRSFSTTSPLASQGLRFWPEDIEAALAYAAELAREGSIDLPAELTA